MKDLKNLNKKPLLICFIVETFIITKWIDSSNLKKKHSLSDTTVNHTIIIHLEDPRVKLCLIFVGIQMNIIYSPFHLFHQSTGDKSSSGDCSGGWTTVIMIACSK